MDYITLPPTLAMAVKVAPEVDIIEIGTPLCKVTVGLDAIRAMRDLVGPDKLILADFKSPDVGGLEAKMAFDAGADMMTVIGGSRRCDGRVSAGGRQGGTQVLMELTGVRDASSHARSGVRSASSGWFTTTSWDEQTFARQWVEEDRTVIRQLIDMGFKITVTGGLTSSLAVLPATCLGRRSAAAASRPRYARSARVRGRCGVSGAAASIFSIYPAARWRCKRGRERSQSAPLGRQRDGPDVDRGWPEMPRL